MQSPCRLCKKPIIWVVDPSGVPVPLDPEPREGGSIAVINGRALRDGAPNWQFWSGPCYEHHAVTCAALKKEASGGND